MKLTKANRDKQIIELYVNQKLTTDVIAGKLNLSSRTVCTVLSEKGLTRSRGESRRLSRQRNKQRKTEYDIAEERESKAFTLGLKMMNQNLREGLI